MPFWQQQLKKEFSLAQVILERGLRLPPDPASNATSQDTGQRHAHTRDPQQKHAQPMANGDTGRWTVPGDALAPLGRSPPPKPGEWNVHRDALAHLRRSPLLPGTPAQLHRVVPMTGPEFQPPGPCPEHELGTYGRRGSDRKKDLFHSRHWSHFLCLNFLLWPNSRLRNHNQGGLWSSPKAENQPSITLSI